MVRSENDRSHFGMLRDVPESRRKVVLKIIKKAGFVGNIAANYGFAMICPSSRYKVLFSLIFSRQFWDNICHGTIGGFSLCEARLERMQLTNNDEPVEVPGSQVIQQSESK